MRNQRISRYHISPHASPQMRTPQLESVAIAFVNYAIIRLGNKLHKSS